MIHPTSPGVEIRPSHTGLAPSDWVTRFGRMVPAGGHVLDVACGSGRHLRWFAAHGHPVVGVDRSDTALAACEDIGELIQADMENAPWPLPDRRFAAVITTNYLWRPLLPMLIGSVAPGGLLIYETFAVGNETVSKPSNPDFLLRPGELLAACTELRVVAYEDGFLSDPPRFVQRIAAVRESTKAGAEAVRRPL